MRLFATYNELDEDVIELYTYAPETSEIVIYTDVDLNDHTPIKVTNIDLSSPELKNQWNIWNGTIHVSADVSSCFGFDSALKFNAFQILHIDDSHKLTSYWEWDEEYENGVLVKSTKPEKAFSAWYKKVKELLNDSDEK